MKVYRPTWDENQCDACNALRGEVMSRCREHLQVLVSLYADARRRTVLVATWVYSICCLRVCYTFGSLAPNAADLLHTRERNSECVMLTRVGCRREVEQVWYALCFLYGCEAYTRLVYTAMTNCDRFWVGYTWFCNAFGILAAIGTYYNVCRHCHLFKRLTLR